MLMRGFMFSFLLPCLLAMTVYNVKELKSKPVVVVQEDFIKGQDNNQMFEELLNMSEKFFVSMNNETIHALFDYVEAELTKRVQGIKAPTLDLNVTLDLPGFGIGDLFNYSLPDEDNKKGRRLLQANETHQCDHTLCRAWHDLFAFISKINRVVSGVKNV